MCVKKGKNDTEVVRIEGEKSGEKPCEMGTEGKGEKEQAFSKRLQTWKTCAAAQIYHKHPNFHSSFCNYVSKSISQGFFTKQKHQKKGKKHEVAKKSQNIQTTNHPATHSLKWKGQRIPAAITRGRRGGVF